MARGSRRGGNKVIDNVRWLGSIGTAFGQAAGSLAVNMASATTTWDTIMRTRGNILSVLDGVPDPGDFVDVGVGLIIVPEGTGTTVLQSPITDTNADWFWYERFAVGYEESGAAVEFGGGMSVYRQVIDSKAMRRGHPDTEIQLVIEQATLGTASAINTVVSLRFLLGN